MSTPVEDDVDDTASDEDFNPDAAPRDEEESSSEDEAAPAASHARKPKGKRQRDDDTIDAELDSGDEATIQERRHNKRRKGGSDLDFSSDDEAGQGGFVRTRAQRKNEQQERKPLASARDATIDVDAIWARLSVQHVGRRADPPKQADPINVSREEYIAIKRTTKFAGQITTEERRVLKTSAEAKLYLEEQEREEASKAKQQQQQQQQQREEEQVDEEQQQEPQEQDVNAITPARPQLRRPLFRRSRFEPNPTGEVKGLPPHLQLRWWQQSRPGAVARVTTRIEAAAAAPTTRPTFKPPAATKLNVVDKSRHDWAGFVDQEGIAEELDEYGRSKQSYLSREDFLSRMEQRREAGRMEAKAKAA